MSALTVSDMVSTNLLSELNLNPVWEKYRGYAFAGSIVTSLYPFYMTLNGIDLHCVPMHDSTTWKNQSLNCTEIADGKLSGPQTAYINSLCATDEKLWFQRYSGAIMLGMAIGILTASSFWLHFKNVKDGIRTFSDARNKFLELDLSKEEIFRLCSNPLKGIESDNLVPKQAFEDWKREMDKAGYSPKDHKTIREVIRLLAYNNPSNSVFTWYLIRSILLILLLFPAVCWLICNMTHTERWSNAFTCRTNGRSGISFKEFVCTSNFSDTMLVYLGVYCAALISQLLLVIWGIVVSTTCNCARCANDGRRSLGMLVQFWESASPIQSGLFKTIVVHIHSSKLEGELVNNMKSICKNEDHELIRIKSKLFGDTPEVISVLKEIFCDSSSRPRIVMCAQAIKASQYSLTEEIADQVVRFIEDMKTTTFENRTILSYELIANMIRDGDLRSILKIKEKINLNRIEDISPYLKPRRSILFYAFSKECICGPHKFAAAKALCQGKHERDLKIFEKRPNDDEQTVISLRQYLKEIYFKNEQVDEILTGCGIIL